jgi:O-antigen/teichoic acid export membrane protein
VSARHSTTEYDVSNNGRVILLAYFKKYFGYGFWVALEVVVIVGLPRLVIFPVTAYLLGKEQFGLFIFSFGIVMMLGNALSGGLVTGVIRNIAKFDGPARDCLIGTSVRLCRIAMRVVICIGMVALAIAGYFWHTDPKIIWCLIPLLLFLYPWNLFDLQMARYRVERRFALRTAWYSLLGTLLVIAIPAAIWGGAVGMAWGYMLGCVITQIILSWKQKILFKKPAYDVNIVALLKPIWVHMSIASVLAFSGRYIYRLILGISHSFSSVAILFAATNIINLCMAPMTILSLLLLSMLGGFAHLRDVGRRQRYTVLGATVLIVVGAILIVLLGGTFLLSVMFPKFSDESARILRLIIMIIPCASIVHFSRPFVVKFGPIKFIPVLNFITLTVHLLPAILLIPRLGIKGAVISYNIGYGLSAISWLGALFWTFKLSCRSDA